jgi:hypothetical protein
MVRACSDVVGYPFPPTLGSFIRDPQGPLIAQRPTMSDATVERTRSALHVAENPVRLLALLHASVNGHVSPRDAKTSTSNRRNGTAQYHIRELVKVGLLERRGRGLYGLTAAGQTIVRLYKSLAADQVDDEPELEIDVWGSAEALGSVLAPGGRLDVVLAERAAGGPRSIRIKRVSG